MPAGEQAQTADSPAGAKVAIADAHAVADIQRHLVLARAKLRGDDHEAALAAYRKVVALDPGHVGALGDIVVVLTRQGKIKEAVAAARAALKAAPRNAALHAQCGQLLIKRTNWTLATEMFQNALDIDPTHTGALGGLASVLTRQGRGEEAIALLRRAVQLRPDQAGMHVRLGQTLEDHHRMAEARASYQAALLIDAQLQPALDGDRRTRDPADIFRLIRAALDNPSDPLPVASLAGEWRTPESDVAALLHFAADPLAAGGLPNASTRLDDLVRQAISRSCQAQDLQRRFGERPPLQRQQIAPLETDCLAEPASHEAWTPLQWIAAFLLREIVPTKKAAVVVTMRDEGLTIVEFVAHYRALGVDSIFIYSNDNIDGSEALLRTLADQGIITYIENRMDGELTFHPQRKAYAHALHLIPELWDHEWALFVDSDELLIPADRYDCNIGALIAEAEARHPDRAPSAICFNWHWCISGGRYDYRPDTLLHRFPHGLGKRGMKSLVRLRETFSMHTIHFPEFAHDGFLVRSDFTRMCKALRWKKLEPVFDSGRLNHYWNKSFEEFVLKKARGDAAGDRDHLWQRDFDLFFKANADETPDNYTPAPAALVCAVEADIDRLMALPGIASLLRDIRAKLPLLLSRFGSEDRLREVYEQTRAATEGQYAVGFGPSGPSGLKIAPSAGGG